MAAERASSLVNVVCVCLCGRKNLRGYVRDNGSTSRKGANETVKFFPIKSARLRGLSSGNRSDAARFHSWRSATPSLKVTVVRERSLHGDHDSDVKSETRQVSVIPDASI